MNPLRAAKLEFISRLLPNPTHAVTISFNQKRTLNSKEEKLAYASKAVSWFVRLLNDRCIGKSHRRTGKHIGCIVVAEGMHIFGRVHLHIALMKPCHLSLSSFIRKLRQSISKTRDFGNADIQPYRDGWYSYITKEKDSEILSEQCHSGTA